MVRYYSDPLDPKRMVLTRDPFISAESYKEMLEKTPIPCTDAVLTVRGDKALYLAKRSVYPMKGVWVLGGRIWFNDATLNDSIARCIEIETGCKFEAKRFKQLPTPHLCSWVRIRQGDFPGKNLIISFRLEITQAELQRMSCGLKPEEYEKEFGIQRFDRQRLIDEKCHPALVDLYDEIFP